MTDRQSRGNGHPIAPRKSKSLHSTSEQLLSVSDPSSPPIQHHPKRFQTVHPNDRTHNNTPKSLTVELSSQRLFPSRSIRQNNDTSSISTTNHVTSLSLSQQPRSQFPTGRRLPQNQIYPPNITHSTTRQDGPAYRDSHSYRNDINDDIDDDSDAIIESIIISPKSQHPTHPWSHTNHRHPHQESRAVPQWVHRQSHPVKPQNLPPIDGATETIKGGDTLKQHQPRPQLGETHPKLRSITSANPVKPFITAQRPPPPTDQINGFKNVSQLQQQQQPQQQPQKQPYRSQSQTVQHRQEKNTVTTTIKGRSTDKYLAALKVKPPSLLELAEIYAVNYKTDPFSLSYCAKILNDPNTPPIILLPPNSPLPSATNSVTATSDAAQNRINNSKQTIVFHRGQYFVDDSSLLKPLLILQRQPNAGYPSQVTLNPCSFINNLNPTTMRNPQHSLTHRTTPQKSTLYTCPSFTLSQPQFIHIPLAHFLLSSYKQSISFNSDQILALMKDTQIEQRLIPPYHCIVTCILRICDYFRLRFDVFMNAFECIMYRIKEQAFTHWQAHNSPQIAQTVITLPNCNDIHQPPLTHHTQPGNAQFTSAMKPMSPRSPFSPINHQNSFASPPPWSRVNQTMTNQSTIPSPQTSTYFSDSDYIIITQRDIIGAIVLSSKFYDNRYDKFTAFKFLNTYSFFHKTAPPISTNYPAHNQIQSKMLSTAHHNQPKSKTPLLTTQSLYSRFFLDLLPGIDLNTQAPHAHLSASGNDQIKRTRIDINPDQTNAPYLVRYGLLQHQLNLLRDASTKPLVVPSQDETQSNPFSPKGMYTKPIHQSDKNNTKYSTAGTSRPQKNITTLPPPPQPLGPLNSRELFLSEVSLFSDTVYNVSFLHTSNFVTILDPLLLIAMNYFDLYDLFNWILYTIFGQSMTPSQLKDEQSQFQNDTRYDNTNPFELKKQSQQPQSVRECSSHPELPPRLATFLHKQLALCPFTFGPTQRSSTPSSDTTTTTQQSDCCPNPTKVAQSQLNSLSGGNPLNPNTTPNLPPLPRSKQVITILRFLCEILIKVLITTQPISFQFHWPSDVICGVIISVLIRLFPLDIQTCQQNIQLYSEHRRLSSSYSSCHSASQPLPVQFDSAYHTEIDKRIKQQLLYFSNSQLTSIQDDQINQLNSNTHQLPPVNPVGSIYNPATWLPPSDLSASSIRSSTNALIDNRSTEQIQFERDRLDHQWQDCYNSIWSGGLLPWLITTDSSHVHSQFLTDQPIKSNISTSSSMSFYDVDQARLYDTKLLSVLDSQDRSPLPPPLPPPALTQSGQQATQLQSTTFDWQFSHTNNSPSLVLHRQKAPVTLSGATQADSTADTHRFNHQQSQFIPIHSDYNPAPNDSNDSSRRSSIGWKPHQDDNFPRNILHTAPSEQIITQYHNNDSHRQPYQDNIENDDFNFRSSRTPNHQPPITHYPSRYQPFQGQQQQSTKMVQPTQEHYQSHTIGISPFGRKENDQIIDNNSNNVSLRFDPSLFQPETHRTTYSHELNDQNLIHSRDKLSFDPPLQHYIPYVGPPKSTLNHFSNDHSSTFDRQLEQRGSGNYIISSRSHLPLPGQSIPQSRNQHHQPQQQSRQYTPQGSTSLNDPVHLRNSRNLPRFE